MPKCVLREPSTIQESKDREMQALRNELLETKAAQQKKDSEMELKEQIEEIRYLYQSLIQRNTTARNLTSEGWVDAPNLLVVNNSRECPNVNCKMLNDPEALFCVKCDMQLRKG